MPSPARPSRGRGRAAGVALVLGAALSAGCAVSGEGSGATVSGDHAASVTSSFAAASTPPMVELRAENRSRYVADRFPDHPVVVDDDVGAESSELFFPSSGTAVVAGPGDAAQLRAASIAVFTHAPLLSYVPEKHRAVVDEIGRLGATRILTVGEVGLAEASGEYQVVQDPGTMSGLGELTAFQFREVVVEDPAQMVQAVANLDGSTPILLTADWDEVTLRPRAGLPPFPVASRRDGGQGPVAVATPASPIPAVTNARSFGSEVRVVDKPDPRESRTALAATIGLADQPLVALGGQFGSGAELSHAIAEAETGATGTEPRPARPENGYDTAGPRASG